MSIVALAGTAEARSKAWAAAVVSGGVPVPEPPPTGPRYVKLAEQDTNVADVLPVLGQPGSLDWYDIYKAWEIVEHAVGGSRQVVARGWVTKADIDRLTASANHPECSPTRNGGSRRTNVVPGSQVPSGRREATSIWSAARSALCRLFGYRTG